MQDNHNILSHLMKKGKTFFMIDSYDSDDVLKFEIIDGEYSVTAKNKAGKIWHPKMTADWIVDALNLGDFITEQEYEDYCKESTMDIEFSMKPSVINLGGTVFLKITKRLSSGKIDATVRCNNRKIDTKCPKYVADAMTKKNFDTLLYHKDPENGDMVLDGGTFTYNIRLDGQPIYEKNITDLEASNNKLIQALVKWCEKLSEENPVIQLQECYRP